MRLVSWLRDDRKCSGEPQKTCSSRWNRHQSPNRVGNDRVTRNETQERGQPKYWLFSDHAPDPRPRKRERERERESARERSFDRASRHVENTSAKEGAKMRVIAFLESTSLCFLPPNERSDSPFFIDSYLRRVQSCSDFGDGSKRLFARVLWLSRTPLDRHEATTLNHSPPRVEF